jgi:hypothetical protein
MPFGFGNPGPVVCQYQLEPKAAADPAMKTHLTDGSWGNRCSRATNDMDPGPLLDLRLDIYVSEHAYGYAK